MLRQQVREMWIDTCSGGTTLPFLVSTHTLRVALLQQSHFGPRVVFPNSNGSNEESLNRSCAVHLPLCVVAATAKPARQMAVRIWTLSVAGPLSKGSPSWSVALLTCATTAICALRTFASANSDAACISTANTPSLACFSNCCRVSR